MDFNIPPTNRKRVVIIGGGFAGLKLAKELRHSGFQIVLLDRNNYHQFQPLLYQVATAGLNPGSIAFPFREDFRKFDDFHFRMTEVKRIFPDLNRIESDLGCLAYDYLVIATGTDTNYYGMEHIRGKAIPMKNTSEAAGLRNQLLMNFEKALSASSEERQRLLNIVVVGGGATGVEITGALAEMKRYIVQKDYPELPPGIFHITLVEGSDRLLGNMSEAASVKAWQFLRRMNVEIRLNTRVVDYRDGKLWFEKGGSIVTETLIWVSGVAAVLPQGLPAETIGKGGRLQTDEYNRVKGLMNIFAIGDNSIQTGRRFPQGHPQVAQVAIQQGKLLARNLKRLVDHQELQPFHYRDLGTLATVGRNKAVADLPHFKTQGFVAWALWLTVHLRSILGVRNKLEILLNWVWNYLTYDRAIRLIFREKVMDSIPPEDKGSGYPS